MGVSYKDRHLLSFHKGTAISAGRDPGGCLALCHPTTLQTLTGGRWSTFSPYLSWGMSASRRNPQEQTSCCFWPLWQGPGEDRVLTSSIGLWGESLALCPAASKGSMRCYQMNPLSIFVWRCAPCLLAPSSTRYKVDNGFSDVVITPTTEPSVTVQQGRRADGHPHTHIPHYLAGSQPQAGLLWVASSPTCSCPCSKTTQGASASLGWLGTDAAGTERWGMTVAKDIISSFFFGLDEKALVQLLQHSLKDYTHLVMFWLIDLVMLLCSEEADNPQTS